MEGDRLSHYRELCLKYGLRIWKQIKQITFVLARHTTRPVLAGTVPVYRFRPGQLTKRSVRPGVGSLFLLRTGLKLKIFRGPAFKKPQ